MKNIIMNKNKNIKALSLLSGGLDSFLASCMVKEQGINITALHFSNLFTKKDNLPQKQSEKLDIPYREEFIGEDFLDILKNPVYGYGKNLNPCIDCRILMLKKTKKILTRENYDFVVTGEVLGQRPMSQKERKIHLIAKKSGLRNKIVRPLSGQKFAATQAEKKGWILREDMLKITGRSRKKQLKLVEEYGFTDKDFSTPAGGCKLTNVEYSNKVRDLIENNNLSVEDVKLLNWGRHFRSSKKFKFIVGRDHRENIHLQKQWGWSDVKLHAKNYKGPLCLGKGRFLSRDIKIMAGVCGRYADCYGAGKIKFNYYNSNSKKEIKVVPFENNKIENYRI